MQDKRRGFVFYRSFYEAMHTLPDSDKLIIYEAICNYALNDTLPSLSGIQNTVFTLIKPQLEANKIRYENGKKGGAPKGNKNALKINRNSTEKQPKEKEKDKDKENDKVKDKDKNAYSNSSESDKLFERFWSVYPKKQNKKTALKAFLKLNPDEKLLNEIISAVKIGCDTEQWQKQGGQFIPLPSTYLNGERWRDELQINSCNSERDTQTDELLKLIKQNEG